MYLLIAPLWTIVYFEIGSMRLVDADLRIVLIAGKMNYIFF